MGVEQQIGFDVEKVRREFPILETKVRGTKRLVYLDNAATTQRPKRVIDTLREFYEKYNSNVHRGAHWLSDLATKMYEDARKTVKNFLNARSHKEIVFVRGTTEGINLIATSFSRGLLKEGDEIIVTEMEHHSNIVPWQLVAQQTGAVLKVIPINDKGELILEELENLITERTKLISVVHVSNSLGTINPVKEITSLAHQKGIPVVVDGAQAVAHIPVDVQDLDCDFYVFSGHKIYGPTGIGVVYGKEEWLDKLPPYQGGGDMIKEVTFERTTYNELPYKFEAGTPNIAGAIGLAEALKWFKQFDINEVHSHENELVQYATELLKEIDGLRIIGEADNKTAVVSFIADGVHPHDIGTGLDMEGVAIRTGHHCTQPVMCHFGIMATARASFAIYNTREEVEIFVDALKKVLKFFRR